MLKLQKSINETMAHGIGGLKQVYHSHPELSLGIQQDVRNHTERALRYAREIFDNVLIINERTSNVRMNEINELTVNTRRYESYR